MKTNVLDEIGAVIGASATMRLVALFGGTNLYVPETMDADHPIARSIGLTAASKLSGIFGREQIEIPDGEDFTRLQRVRRVAGLLRAGTSPRDVSMLVGVGYRQVCRYRSEAEAMGILPLVFSHQSPPQPQRATRHPDIRPMPSR